MDDAAQRPRRRFIVGKTFFGLTMLFLLVSAGGRIWWGWYADRQYQAVVDRIRARGEPVTWAEMKPPPIPDDQNAVEVYKRVLAMPGFEKAMDLKVAPKSATQPAGPGRPGGMPGFGPPPGGGLPGSGAPAAEEELVLLDKLSYSEKAYQLSDKLSEKEFRRKHPEFVKTFLDMTDRQIAEMAKARGLKSDFKLNYDKPAFEALVPALSGYRGLADISRNWALAAHDRGDDAAAIRYTSIGWDTGESLESGQSLISHMVSVANQTIMLSGIEQIASDLKVGASPSAGRQEVEELIRRLLDTQGLRNSLARAFMSERTFGLAVMQMMMEDPRSLSRMQESSASESPMPAPALSLLYLATGPMWKMQAAEHMELIDSYVLATKAGAVSFSPPTPIWMNNPNALQSVSHMMSMLLTPAFSRVFMFQNRTIAMRRLAATALAIRLFELDHGKRPATLAELCPKYIPAVPEDPFDPAKGAIRYLPNAKYPILYSIGPDELDSGGQFALKGTTKKDLNWEQLDMPFFLDGPDGRQKAIDELSAPPAGLPLGPGSPVRTTSRTSATTSR